MKALPSIAFGGFSGSAKDVTARQLGGRTVLSVRSRPTGPASSAQISHRAMMARITKSYKRLSDAQMKDWERLARQCAGASVFGQRAQLSAHNLFVRLNANLLLSGGQMRTEAPVGPDDVPGVRFSAMYVSSDGVRLEGIDETDEDLRLVVKMSAAQSPGVSSAWSRTVVVSPGTETDWGELDLTEAFADVMGVGIEDGRKYFAELYWIDSATGFSGPVTQVCGIAGPGPFFGAEGGSARSLIRVRDLENSDRCYFKDFEYELSRGPVIATCRGEYGFRNTRTNAYVDLDEDAQARFARQRCVFLCRGNYGKNWSIGHLHVTVSTVTGRFQMGVTPHFDSQNYGGLVFDTAAPEAI